MFKRKEALKQEADNVISRKAFREYQRENGIDDAQNTIHRMHDGRVVDTNGEIHTPNEDVPGERKITQRLMHNKRYDVDEIGNLTVLGKQQRLKFRLNIAIVILVLLIIATFLILRFVG